MAHEVFGVIWTRLSSKIEYLKNRERVFYDVPTLAHARLALSEQREYWEMRKRTEDPFFQEETSEAEKAVYDALDALDRLQEAGYPTGIREAEHAMARRWSDEREAAPRTSASYD